ncbi:MAG: LamG domain-containing protein [Candidatus Pacebacteria bacterium]|nr:LamG domain-containing protein [Candidatus Paceibacterota bacterium]
MNKSFTLIEILVVIVIIGIISGFIIVSMSGISSKASIAKSQAFANSLRNSLLMNLVSEWKLNGSADDSWGANNGTLIGPTHLPVLKTSSDCVSGSCYQLDGIDDYISIPNNDSLNITGRVTVEIWVNPGLQTGSWRGIIDREASYMMGYGIRTTAVYSESSTGVQFKASNGTERGVSANVTNNKWNHLAGTYDGNNLKIYANSILVAPVASTDGIGNVSSILTIGTLSYSTASYLFNGLVDEAKVYNEAIPTSRIQENYYSGLSRLLANGSIIDEEYEQRLAELKLNLSRND